MIRKDEVDDDDNHGSNDNNIWQDGLQIVGGDLLYWSIAPDDEVNVIWIPTST